MVDFHYMIMSMMMNINSVVGVIMMMVVMMIYDAETNWPKLGNFPS